jgi:hypothetical protein
MKRRHRTAHRKFWPALALLVGVGLAMALVMRAPPSSAPPAIEGSR